MGSVLITLLQFRLAHICIKETSRKYLEAEIFRRIAEYLKDKLRKRRNWYLQDETQTEAKNGTTKPASSKAALSQIIASSETHNKTVLC